MWKSDSNQLFEYWILFSYEIFFKKMSIVFIDQ